MKESRAESVLIVEDDLAALEGIKLFLRRKKLTVYEATRTVQALEIFESVNPQVVVLDIVLLDDGDTTINNVAGIGLAKSLRSRCPQLGIVFRSAYTHFRKEILDLIKDGQGGLVYLFKSGGRPEQLLDAIQMAYTGGIHIEPKMIGTSQSLAKTHLDSLPKAERALVTELLARFDVLTPREAQILKRLAWSRRTIAQRLNISARTVDRHISNIYAKLNLTQADQPDLRQDVVLAKAYMIHELHKEFQS